MSAGKRFIENAPTPVMQRTRQKTEVDKLQDIEEMRDIADLKSDCEDAAKALDGWKEEEIRRIAAPLLQLAPECWPCRSRRIELLQMRYFPEDLPEDLKQWIAGDLQTYLENYKEAASACMFRTNQLLPLDDFAVVARKLLVKRTSEWTKDEVMEVIEFLKGCPSVDARTGTGDSANIYVDFMDLWAPYAFSRPWIQRAVDPYYVVINCFGAAPPAGLAATIAAYPPPLSPAPALLGGLNGCGYIFPFASSTDARQFIGWVQNAHPGLRIWLTVGNIAPPIYY
eukprot:CAMPEP_0196719560 /NCGR_PEP_ID=MMETSP1091-20130531/2515_1 /TAXON_ID=302021 /ORGANISM="Rhodomonas sp., Strain CCMP768" /LENGTH=282 /DNA_ID=CAMNT_0042060539 /DNA_START=80 /DNA_END=928 /DNA_ORIENTATION=+